MRKKLFILTGIMAAVLATVLIIVFFINRKNENTIGNQDEKIKVVTSFYPVYVLTKNLTKDIAEFEVDSLTDFSAGCLHDYQLKTSDMKLLSNADVFIINGGGMEEYLTEVIDSYPKLKVIDLSKGIDMLSSDIHEGEKNPHVWLDPELYMLQIENAGEGLEGYILEHLNNEALQSGQDNDKDVISKLNSNLEAYLKDVRELADDMNQILATVNDMMHGENISNKVVVFHDSFAYLSRKAGLDVAYTVEIDEDTPLSAADVAEVINVIRKDNIQYLFTEEQYDDTILDRIMDETDAKAYIIDSAVTGDADLNSYLQAMRSNIETLRNAFTGQ